MKLSLYVGIAALLAGLFIGYAAWHKTPGFGSVAVSNDYIATTTAANTVFGASISADKVIKTGYGALGSVVITGANTGVVNFYNATTSDVNLRTGNIASSSILIASIPASAAAGTYTFDAQFTAGLLINVVSGNTPTTTITYR